MRDWGLVFGGMGMMRGMVGRSEGDAFLALKGKENGTLCSKEEWMFDCVHEIHNAEEDCFSFDRSEKAL